MRPRVFLAGRLKEPFDCNATQALYMYVRIRTGPTVEMKVRQSTVGTYIHDPSPCPVLSRVGDREDTGLLCWAVMVERWPHQQLTGQRRIRE